MNAMLKRTVLGFVLVFALTVVSPICAFASMKGDVNENGEVNIVDVQIAYDISCGVYDDMPNLSAMLVAADVNEDGTVDPADAFAIQRYVMTGSFKRAPLTIDAYSVKGDVITASFTYTNMRNRDSSASNDYAFSAHQGGYALSTGGFGDDYFASVQPGYSSSFTLSWRMRSDGDVSVAATPYDWANGAPAERVLRVSGTSAKPPAPSAPLTIDAYSVKGDVITASFTYTNMRNRDSSASNDYAFSAHQGGYALSTGGFGDDYFASVQPGYSSSFTLSWRMRSDGDVSVAATPYDWANGAPAERVLRVSGTSAKPPAPSAPLTIDAYSVKGDVITASFTYTNMRNRDSSASNDYAFSAHQGGYALSTGGFGDDYFASVQPGYSSSFTLSWRMRSDGDVSVAATPYDWANGAPAERVLRVSGS